MTPVRRFGDVDLGAIEERFENENMQLLLNNLENWSTFSMSLIPGGFQLPGDRCRIFRCLLVLAFVIAQFQMTMIGISTVFSPCFCDY
jgi:hypothetical protein